MVVRAWAHQIIMRNGAGERSESERERSAAGSSRKMRVSHRRVMNMDAVFVAALQKLFAPTTVTRNKKGQGSGAN